MKRTKKKKTHFLLMLAMMVVLIFAATVMCFAEESITSEQTFNAEQTVTVQSLVCPESSWVSSDAKMHCVATTKYYPGYLTLWFPETGRNFYFLPTEKATLGADGNYRDGNIIFYMTDGVCNSFYEPKAGTYVRENSNLLECTVKFDIQGHGTAPASMQNIPVGSKIIKPEDPSAEGFTFKGWYLDKDCTALWDFENYEIIVDTILYAKWEENKPIPIEKVQAPNTGDSTPVYLYAIALMLAISGTFTIFIIKRKGNR